MAARIVPDGAAPSVGGSVRRVRAPATTAVFAEPAPGGRSTDAHGLGEGPLRPAGASTALRTAWRRPFPDGLVVALLALLALGLSLRDARRDSATADEPIHAAAGVSQVTSGTWLVNVEHPPLAKQLVGISAVGLGGAEPPRLDFRDFFRSTRSWLFASRDDSVLFASRASVALLFAALVVGAWAAAGKGPGGIAASALLVGNTAVFPHGHLVTTDVPLALFTVLLAGSLRRFDEARRLRPALAASVWLAAALATKYSAILLLPLTVLALLARRDGRPTRRDLLAAAGVPVAAILILAAALSWSVRGEEPEMIRVLGRVYRMPKEDLALLERVDSVHRGLARWGFGLLFHLRQAEAGRLTYFDGPTSHPGAHYHVVALVVKSPVVWLAGVLAGAYLAARGGPRFARLSYVAALLLFAGSLPGPRIGVRHVFPSIVFLTLGAGAALGPSLSRLPRVSRAGLLLVALSPLASDRNLGTDGLVGRLVGRPVLADSNLDWGQDLLRLRDLLARRGIPSSQVGIAYFGGDDPSLRIPGVADLLESSAPPRRYLAVSRHLLLLGPEAVLVTDTSGRAARSLALARDPGSRLVARAGESLELFDLGGTGGGGAGAAPSARRAP